MSNQNKTEVATGGLSFSTILFLIFLVLKLTGYITWSWWWVTVPLWGGLALVIAILLIAFIVLGIIGAIEAFK